MIETPASEVEMRHAQRAAEPGTRTVAGKRTMVDVEALRKEYPGRRKDSLWSRLRSDAAVPPFVAVDGISFQIYEGEIFGLLGPNGAGKTTTIRMLSTLLEPSAGSARIDGYDVQTQPNLVRQRLGAVLTGERSIYWKLTGRENLEYFAALNHIPPTVARQRVAELLKRLGLAQRADEYVERYSSGMKQRIAIARALLANPPVLLLDEPTIGLDPQSARNLRELIGEIKAEGRTILLTTHYMEEADQLCDRIGIVDAGRIIALDTPERLKASIRQLDVLRVEIEGATPGLVQHLRALPGVEQLAQQAETQDGATSLALHTSDSRSLVPEIIALVTTSGGRLRHLHLTQPTLEDVFIALTGKQLRD